MTRKSDHADLSPADTNSQSGASKRRRLVAAGAVAGAFAASAPPRWRRPLVQSVLLPAHAQTSHVAGGIAAASPLSAFTLTGHCSAAGDDQYYLITFSDQPAKPTSTITIASVSSNPGSQFHAGDDALWFFARHGSGTFDVYFEQVDFASARITSNDCQNPSHSHTSQDILLVNGGVCLRFEMTYGGSVGAPTVMFSQFGLFKCS